MIFHTLKMCTGDAGPEQSLVLLESEMVNEENDCHSHIFEPLFSNHSKTMMLKMKVDIHVFSAVEKYFLRCYH